MNGSIRTLLLVAGLVATVYFVTMWFGKPSPQGTPKYEVSGFVTVNGEPVEGVIVQLFAEDGEMEGQDSHPMAATDHNGLFVLSSFGGADGAAAGDYAVTFFWPVDPLKMEKDRFQGRYSQPEASLFKVSIQPQPTMIPSFDLEIPDNKLLPAERTMESLRQEVLEGKTIDDLQSAQQATP